MTSLRKLGKLSKTVPLTNPNFTKLVGARLNTLRGKVEDFALGGNLRSLVGARMGKVFDLDVSWRFQPPANFVKLGLVKGTVFDSAHLAETVAATASESRLEERCGNHVFFDKVLERSYNDYGYWADGAYHYNICDYLGNVRTVVKSDGTLCERNDYYPFGMLHDPSAANADVQPHKYGGKELDRQNGLDLYDSHARWYDPVLARTTTMDSKAEEFPWVSPYAWCNANPIRLVDEDGERPSPYEAALMSSAVYRDKDNYSKRIAALEKADWYISDAGSTMQKNHPAWTGIGLQSMVFERETENGKEYAYVFAGTNSWEDGVEDVLQLVGLAPQYKKAIENAKSLSEEVGSSELTFVGHSMGAGQAAAASMATGRAAIGFNPAAISALTRVFNGLFQKGDIVNYISSTPKIMGIQITTDAITNLQNRMGIVAPGKNIPVAVGFYPTHDINKLVEALEPK